MIFLAAYPIFDAFFEIDEDQIWNGWKFSLLFFLSAELPEIHE